LKTIKDLKDKIKQYMDTITERDGKIANFENITKAKNDELE
jgi:hypothetical protein